MAQKHDFFSSLLYVRYWVHVFMHMNEGFYEEGVAAHPSSYKGPCHCQRSEAGCEIQLIVIMGCRSQHTVPACQGAPPSPAFTLHICIVSSYQHPPIECGGGRSRRRVTAASLISINVTQGQASEENWMSPTPQTIQRNYATPPAKKKKKRYKRVSLIIRKTEYSPDVKLMSWDFIDAPPFFIPPPALQLFGGVNVALSVTCGPMQSIRLFLISGWLRFQSLFKWAPTKPEAPARSLPASSFPTFSSKYCCEGAQLACLLSLW